MRYLLEILVSYWHKNILLYYIIIYVNVISMTISDLLVHVSTCVLVGHHVIVKRTAYCTYSTTFSDEVSVLDYVACSMAIFVALCSVLVLFDYSAKNSGFW
jgi:hypothetical protein